ncbi:MAG: hypothetical protein CM1200mP39_06540 [Dehalococcoidia bacterium]|nr:MAG: hypothetical protein CM1200mP39_06540 [Dehalococcoidia bacterium]
MNVIVHLWDGRGEDLVLGSPYDYEKNTLIVVPEDLPAPGEPGFAKASAEALIDIAKARPDVS